MRSIDCDVAVVGAGPAGVAAALGASSAGADVVLVDDARRPGGQIWRRPAPELDAGAPAPPPLVALRDSAVRLLSETAVWGADGTVLLLAGSPVGDDPAELRSRSIVVATGAYDRPVAFPGWTLPGVLTPGGAQATLKGSRVAPGRRALVAGAGPFLLVVARALAEAGVEVAQVAEATAPSRWLAHGRRALRHPDRLAELARHRGALRAAGVPVRHGRMVVRAEGDGRVERAVVARVDRDWRPVAGSEETVDLDLLCVGFGFIPNVELAAALGCATRWHPRMAAHVVAVGRDQDTSVPGVFAAGEPTGIGGADLAAAEGAIAGAQAARHARAAATDVPPAAGQRATATGAPTAAQLRARAKHRHLASLLTDLFAIRPGAWELADDDTLVCRCEEVTLGAVRAAAATGDGPVTANALKVTTRVGMGRCQGRVCGPLVARALGDPAVGFTQRPPMRPIPLATLASASAASATPDGPDTAARTALAEAPTPTTPDTPADDR